MLHGFQAQFFAEAIQFSRFDLLAGELLFQLDEAISATFSGGIQIAAHGGELAFGVGQAFAQGDHFAIITVRAQGISSTRQFLAQMLGIGEQTGALPEMLLKVADNYDEEVDNAVSAMTSLLEPIMIVFLAVIVGSIVIALFLPLITLIDKLGSDGDGKGGE